MTDGKGKRRGFLALCLFGSVLFAALGAWQVQRLGWKRALIARVESRIHAPAVALPPASDWPAFDAHAAEYRRVRVQGRFLHDRETRVDALTERGAGAWILTPMQVDDGVVLVNRGFVPSELRDPERRPVSRSIADATVVGLLRVSEPGGRMLRPNDPAADRWFSRDVAAIARARGLAHVAPFFIDADATPNPGGLPIGGLTVVQFRNAHLEYALTWFGLAALCIVGGAMVYRAKPVSGRGQR